VKAMELYRKSADEGNLDAMDNVGWLYKNGLGVTQDYSQAIYWYKKAAEKGDDWGADRLGQMYMEGIGVPVNKQEAAKWFKVAADQGNADARDQLATLNQASNNTTTDTTNTTNNTNTTNTTTTTRTSNTQTTSTDSTQAPLSEADVKELLTHGVSSKRAIVLVKKYGVDFSLNDDKIATLKQAGADSDLLLAISISKR